MTLNEAKLRTRLGIKVKLPHWTAVMCIHKFHDNGEITYELRKNGEIRTRPMPGYWHTIETWEIVP